MVPATDSVQAYIQATGSTSRGHEVGTHVHMSRSAPCTMLFVHRCLAYVLQEGHSVQHPTQVQTLVQKQAGSIMISIGLLSS